MNVEPQNAFYCPDCQTGFPSPAQAATCPVCHKDAVVIGWFERVHLDDD